MQTASITAGVVTQGPMPLPIPRGVASEALIAALAGQGATADVPQTTREALRQCKDILADGDLQVALFCMYELHYGGFTDVDENLEWDLEILAARALIEEALEAHLREIVELPTLPRANAADISETLFAMAANQSGPSVSRFVAHEADRAQLREFLAHRSIFTLKEADPQSFAIPRLTGKAKAALVEIMADEYGEGRPQRMHSAIFTRTMTAAGLDPSFGAYVDAVPAVTLASVNIMSLFSLRRRLRGAIIGHTACYEMTSTQPNRLYGHGFKRNGFDEDARWYFDEHVEADAVHEQIASHDMAGSLGEASPELVEDIIFGAATCGTLDAIVGEHIIGAWSSGESSLVAELKPVPAPVA